MKLSVVHLPLFKMNNPKIYYHFTPYTLIGFAPHFKSVFGAKDVICGNAVVSAKKKKDAICSNLQQNDHLGQLPRKKKKEAKCGSPAKNENDSRLVFIFVAAAALHGVMSCYNSVMMKSPVI